MAGKKSDSESVNATESDVPEEQDRQTWDKTEETAPAEEGGNLVERLEAAEAKAEEHYERLLRVTAEFENYKKRSEREMNDFRKFANESLMKEILPVMDNLERALATEYEQGENTLKGLREGVEMTLKGLMDSLERFGVVPMEALGQPFDPNFHQAVSQEETEAYPDDTVSKELQKGYLLNGRLLRPSMVIVSRRRTNKTDKSSPEDSGVQPSKISEEQPMENAQAGKKIKVTVH